jgi:hypothetical protein
MIPGTSPLAARSAAHAGALDIRTFEQDDTVAPGFRDVPWTRYADGIGQIGPRAIRSLAEVRRLAGGADDARVALEQALRFYEQKTPASSVSPAAARKHSARVPAIVRDAVSVTDPGTFAATCSSSWAGSGKMRPKPVRFSASFGDMPAQDMPSSPSRHTYLPAGITIGVDTRTGDDTSIRQRSGGSHVSVTAPCPLHIRMAA